MTLSSLPRASGRRAPSRQPGVFRQIVCLWVFAVLVAAAPAARAQPSTGPFLGSTPASEGEIGPRGSSAAGTQPASPGPGFRIRWDDRPSFRFGHVLRLDIIAKFQVDARAFDPTFDGQPDDVEVTRKRLGVTGRLLEDLEFEFESELRRENPIRDAFVNFSKYRVAEIKAGKYKIPFSLDELTSATRLDFIYRSRIADNFAPGRDIGGTVHGRLADRTLTYQAGVFRRDGENARFGENPGAGATFAARVTGRPLRASRISPAARDLEVGLSVTDGWIEEGLNGLRAVTASDAEVFSPVYVKGNRRRFGLDAAWLPGPFGFKGELIHMFDNRRDQSLTDDDLSDVLGRGWYATASWVVTGEDKEERIDPRRDLVTGGGLGAFELAARYEFIRFGSREHPGPPFSNPRAENIRSQSDRVWTLGLNWYWNALTKIQFNAIRERIEDTARAPVSGTEVFWSFVTRVQFAM